MKKRLRIDYSIFEFLILIFLAMASLIYLNGCMLTPKAIELANEKAEPQYEYWNIKRAVSAVRQANGDVSLCVELNNADEIKVSKSSTITIPRPILQGEANQHERYGFAPGECPLPCYWYPIEKVEKGCDKITPENFSPKSSLPIVKSTVHSQDEFYDLINTFNENQKVPDKIFEVRNAFSDTSTIYWFVQIDPQRTVPNSIAGVYEDQSTNLYYLTVPPAFVGDVIIVVVGTAVVIVGIALGVYLKLL